MIDFINNLKKPGTIDLQSVRKYSENTPSVTGLLSLIDNYEPNNIEEALERGTNFHKDMENLLKEKPINKLAAPDLTRHMIPYMYLLKAKEGTKLHLEHKVEAPGLFGGTLDYLKSNSLNISELKDFKSASTIPSMSSPLFYKYRLQLHGYAMLAYSGEDTISPNVDSMSLVFSSSKGAAFYKIPFDYNESIKFSILILYYHYLNGSLLNDNMVLYLREFSIIRESLELNLQYIKENTDKDYNKFLDSLMELRKYYKTNMINMKTGFRDKVLSLMKVNDTPIKSINIINPKTKEDKKKSSIEEPSSLDFDGSDLLYRDLGNPF